MTPAVNGKQLAPGLLLVPNVNLSSPKLKPKIDSSPNGMLFARVDVLVHKIFVM